MVLIWGRLEPSTFQLRVKFIYPCTTAALNELHNALHNEPWLNAAESTNLDFFSLICPDSLCFLNTFPIRGSSIKEERKHIQYNQLTKDNINYWRVSHYRLFGPPIPLLALEWEPTDQVIRHYSGHHHPDGLDIADVPPARHTMRSCWNGKKSVIF